jgi:hypothetical protein
LAVTLGAEAGEGEEIHGEELKEEGSLGGKEAVARGARDGGCHRPPSLDLPPVRSYEGGKDVATSLGSVADTELGRKGGCQHGEVRERDEKKDVDGEEDKNQESFCV